MGFLRGILKVGFVEKYGLIGLKYHRGSILCKLHKVLMEITGGEVFQATKHFDIFNIIDNLK